MKKEKRKLTLEQLERKEKFEKKIPLIIMILSFCVFFALIITIIIADIYFKNGANINKICSVYICIELFLVALMIISFKALEKTEKQTKVKELQQLADEHGGHIKELVRIKDEDIIADILSRCIEKLVIDIIQDKNFEVTIKFVDDTSRTGVCVPIREFVSILDKDSQNAILNDFVKDIRLEKSVGDAEKIVINSQDYVYEKDVSADKLLEMFELKE